MTSTTDSSGGTASGATTRSPSAADERSEPLMRGPTPGWRRYPRSAASRAATLALAAATALLLWGLSLRGASAAPTRTPFDHLTTGFELLGHHRDLPCE